MQFVCVNKLRVKHVLQNKRLNLYGTYIYITLYLNPTISLFIETGGTLTAPTIYINLLTSQHNFQINIFLILKTTLINKLCSNLCSHNENCI